MELIVQIRDFILAMTATVISVIRILVMSRPHTMKQGRNHDDCLIIGNGPSFKESIQDHEKIPYKDIICVNFFPLTDYFEKLTPDMLLISAPELYNGKGNENIRKRSKDLFTQMDKKVSWPIQICLPAEAKKHKDWQLTIQNNPFISLKYYNNTPIEGWILLYVLPLKLQIPHSSFIQKVRK